MTAQRPRILDTPVPAVSDTVEKLASMHGERRARRAGLVTLLAAADLFLKRHDEDRARAREAMQRALDDYERARAGIAYWRGAIADLVDELVVVKVAPVLEHRNMFRAVTMVKTTPLECAEGAHVPIGESTHMIPKTMMHTTYRAILARGGRCWKPRHAPRVAHRDYNPGKCPARCTRSA